MSLVQWIRVVDLVLIGLSVGFTGSLYWNLESAFSRSHELARAQRIYMLAYTALAVAAMGELQHAIQDGKGATWRTAVVTFAALLSASGSVWCWMHWQQISTEMKEQRG